MPGSTKSRGICIKLNSISGHIHIKISSHKKLITWQLFLVAIASVSPIDTSYTIRIYVNEINCLINFHKIMSISILTSNKLVCLCGGCSHALNL